MSDDEQGVYNHLRNERYLGSMKPLSVSVSQDSPSIRPKKKHAKQHSQVSIQVFASSNRSFQAQQNVPGHQILVRLVDEFHYFFSKVYHHPKFFPPFF